MKFLDQAKIFIKSGDGGAGCVSFRREKYVEFGGPDGGNGGKGGDVIFVAGADMNTLIDFRYTQHFKAQKGEHGKGRNKTGAHGKDLVIKIPVGTQILDEDRETVLADFTEKGQRMLFLRGGDGGFGNAHYKSSTNQAPRKALPGWPGEERDVWLRLKLIADAGLVGLPNAGKSTFLAACSRAKPKIADYPFTTLHPNLGVVKAGDFDFVLADIPGLIEGASEGHGLGDRFLGHIERTEVILHLVDMTQDDPANDYKTIRNELTEYGHGLEDKTEIIALNKADALGPELAEDQQKLFEQKTGKKTFLISAVSGDKVDSVLYKLSEIIKDARTEKDDSFIVKMIEQSKRIVIKIGSVLVTDHASGSVKSDWLASLAHDIAGLKNKEVIIVSSGAIALGRKGLNIPSSSRPGDIALDRKQAAAAVGQVILSNAYRDAFQAHGIETAQILLSPADTENRRSHINARETIQTLLAHGVIPIVNENDSTATEEIRFGDNDRLAARVAQMVEADLLVLLSTTDGLYTANPDIDPDAQHIPQVDMLDDLVRSMAQDALPGLSTGGMTSKLDAAEIANRAGVSMMIARGTDYFPLSNMTRYTLFPAKETPLSARKKWIQGHVKPKGTLTIDDGAVKAMREGRSLLPIGVTKIVGAFDRGDAVRVVDAEGREIAIGLIAFGHISTTKIIGKHSHEIPDILGYSGRTELIHRNDLVLLM